ncbi:MAG: acyltransferase [Candidatus Eremiobacteraeota bacterium]|nr:acyltransferase [Candidatus Eremiobacteraeota bacterium]MBV8353997.1 acyltransferase [Candidatus Eremiobacteraeota bacterium]
MWYHLWQVSWLDPHIAIGHTYISLVYLPVAGFLGVQLFFFISAFCLSYPYVRAHFAEKPLPTLRHFAYRRFIKIVPSYLLSIVAVVALAAIPANRESFGANIGWPNPGAALFDLAAHLTFLHTYFGNTVASINGVLWTLGIEVQFYVLFPMLVWILLRTPLSLTAMMTALAIAYRVHVGECCRTPIFDHNINQLFGFLDFFAAGMLCAYAYEWLRFKRPKLAEQRGLWTALALGGFVWAILMFQHLEHQRWADRFADWFVIRNSTFYAAAILAAGLGSLLAFPAWHRLLANRVLVFLSVISYNLYLWHQVLVRWVAATIPHRPSNPHLDGRYNWEVFIAGIIVTVGVATAITYLFERPLLRMEPAELMHALRAILRQKPREIAQADS